MYVRFEGKHNFGAGGEAHDVMNVLKKIRDGPGGSLFRKCDRGG